jgi:hypothetical protein
MYDMFRALPKSSMFWPFSLESNHINLGEFFLLLLCKLHVWMHKGTRITETQPLKYTILTISCEISDKIDKICLKESNVCLCLYVVIYICTICTYLFIHFTSCA